MFPRRLRLHNESAAVLFVAILTSLGLVCAQPGQARADLKLDFSAYAPGTTIDQVHIPGVTFIAANPAKVTVSDNTTLNISGVAGVDLVIQIAGGADGGSVDYDGSGSCQGGSDFVSWFDGADQLDLFDTFVPGPGRCADGTLSRGFRFTEIRFDVFSDQFSRVLDVSNLTFGVAAKGTAAPALSECGLILLTLLLAGYGWSRSRTGRAGRM